jgi:hypothetical protein
MARQTAGQPKRKRWGLRALAFLALALASIIASNGLSANGAGAVPITFVGTFVGLGGAAYCSFRGLRGVDWLPRP